MKRDEMLKNKNTLCSNESRNIDVIHCPNCCFEHICSRPQALMCDKPQQIFEDTKELVEFPFVALHQTL